VRGFTLIELMIVVALVGLASSLVVLSIRDPAATRLEHEAARLAALLESARAESRASGLPVRWVPGHGAGGADDGPDFRFVGLPRTIQLPSRWLDPATSAEVIGSASLPLGPEPIIGAQRIVLRLADKRLDLATDGLGPFAVVGADAPLESPP
jgi:general secretion pathway protein H